jgi:hypothetical protein
MLPVVLRAYHRRSNELAPLLTSLSGVVAPIMLLIVAPIMLSSPSISTLVAVGLGMLVLLSKSNCRAKGGVLIG